MKATKKQIAEVSRIAESRNVPVEFALNTLSNCSASIYKVIGAAGVVDSAEVAHSKHWVNTMDLAKKANRMDVSINELMTSEQRNLYSNFTK